MNACRLREEAIGGAVRLRIGKLVEVREGRAGLVSVKAGVHVEVFAACKLDFNASGW